MTHISLITATLNAAATLTASLQSVSAQSLLPEHLIIDGGSTDGTLALAARYAAHPLKVFSEPDRGLYDAMNKGLAKASGEIIGILNADDCYARRDVLQLVAEAFRDPRIDACYGDLCYVDGSDAGRVVRYWRSGAFHYRRFFWGWMPPHPTFFVRRAAYEKYGVFNLGLGSAADYELMLRFLVRHRLQAAYLPRVLVNMRTGGVSNASLAGRLKANRMDRKAWEVNGLRPYPWTLLCKPLRKVGQWLVRYRPGGDTLR